MRTIFYHFVMIGSLFSTLILELPLFLFKKNEKKQKFTREVARRWAKKTLWSSGSKASIIYENNSESYIKEIVERNEAVIYISNHQSNLDIPVLLAKMPMNFAFIAKKEMEKWPIIGMWMKSLKCIFLDRKNVRQGMKDMREAMKLVEAGYSYVIFPEGSRSDVEKVGEFKKGSFKLAIDTGVKIVPLTLVGTYKVQRKGSLKISKNDDIKIIIDKPLDYESMCSEDKKNIHIITRNIIKSNFEKYYLNRS